MTPEEQNLVYSYIILAELPKVLAHDMDLMKQHKETAMMAAAARVYISMLEEEMVELRKELRRRYITDPKKYPGKLVYEVKVKGYVHQVEFTAEQLKTMCEEKLKSMI